MFLTHLRIDALFFGVVLDIPSFPSWTHPELASATAGPALLWKGITALLIQLLLRFSPRRGPFMQSFGFTLSIWVLAAYWAFPHSNAAQTSPTLA